MHTGDDDAPRTFEQETTSPREVKRLSGRRPRAGVLQHLLLGSAATAVFFAILASPRLNAALPMAFIEKLTQRGWTQYAAVFLTFWSLSILLGKVVTILRRRRLFRVNLIPREACFTTDRDIDRVIDAIWDTSRRLRDTLLGPRICRALEHFLASRDIKEVGDVLREESDADFALMESSYTPVKVSLWTIPILGFIGTVMGVSDAVGGFGDFLTGAKELDQIKTALSEVTRGLSVAFDTTYVALILSVILMLIMSAVEKLERDQLYALEEYGQNRVVRPLAASAVAGERTSPMVAAAAPATAWSQELQAWGQALTDSLNAAWDRISREWQVNRHALQQESAGERLQLQTRITDLMTEMKTQSEHLSGQAQALTAASSLLREHLEAERRDLSEMLREQGLILIKYLEADGLEDGKLAALLELQHKLEAGLTQIAERDGLAALLQDIRRTLTALDPALNRLVEKPLEVEVHFVAGVPKVIRE
jgi:hypothetical protein